MDNVNISHAMLCLTPVGTMPLYPFSMAELYRCFHILMIIITLCNMRVALAVLFME